MSSGRAINICVTTSGVVSTALATAREFEDQTFKEMILSPARRGALVMGKLLGSWVTTLIVAAVILGVGFFAGLLRPSGVYWIPTVGMVMLVALASAGLGLWMFGLHAAETLGRR